VTSEGVAFSAGDFVGDVSNAGSLGEDPSITLLSGASEYDTTDYFAEISVPLLANLPGAQELTATGSFRRSDYSTFGENDTYGYGLVWQPIDDVRFRGSFSRAVRVPNLFELFSPAQGAFFRPADPCDATQIATAPDPALRQANCEIDLRANNVSDAELFTADGTYAFQDPLSAGFPGTTGGNSSLTEEVADTVTYGVVVQPRFVPGLTLTVDYWDIEIEDAIVAISAQNIVNGCYDSPSLDNAFCPLISRNPAADSAQNGGLTSLNQTRLNFGAVEAEGFDLGALYQFEVLGVGVDLSMNATRQDQLDLIEPSSPGEPPVVNPELGEMRRPEWASQFGVGLSYGPYSLSWSGVYYDEMTLGYEDGGEIETIEQNYGGAGVADARLIQDIRGAWQASDALTVYGGVSNLTNRQPYVSEFGYPVSPRGAYFFMGVTYNGAAR
jgi:outer membrane receptor protein involved in Fe transport